MSKSLEFEQSRAKANLNQAIEYRKLLEWIKVVIEQNIYDKAAIVKEIEVALENKVV